MSSSTTRMKIAQHATVYHRIEAAGGDDFGNHDVGTTEALARNLGSNTDFEIDCNDANLLFVTGHQIVTNTRAAFSSAAYCDAFIQIKHTGFQDAAKTIASTSGYTLKLSFSNTEVINFCLSPGESILLHNPGSSLDQANNYWAWANVTSGLNGAGETIADENIYVEIICAKKEN